MPRRLNVTRTRRRWISLAAAIGIGLLNGCAHYAPLPLPETPPLRRDWESLQGFTPVDGHGTSIQALVALALQNNPELLAGRRKRGVAQAQLLQAGLLPNPSFGGALLPLISGPGTVTAWNIGITEDIKSLVTYRSKRRAAGFAARQVEADLLWQEWQLAGEVRQVAVDLIVGQKMRASLAEAYELLSKRNAEVQRALQAGNATLVSIAPSMTALQAARTNLDAQDQHQLELRHRLNALLGLEATVAVPLADEVTLPAFDPQAIREAALTLPERRPDLLALRLGYLEQEEAVRQEIRAQFPDLVLGGSMSSDNSKVINGGPQVSLGLPVFNRNQGNVAVARATRAQLNGEYAARLGSAVGEVQSLLEQRQQLGEQLERVRRDLPALRAAAERASAAFDNARLDERSYLDLVTNRFAKEQEIMTLELAVLQREIALQTLVGAELPRADLVPSAQSSQP